MIENDNIFKTGLKQFRTPLHFQVHCDDGAMIEAIESIGGDTEYANERTVYFHLNGVRMSIGHNWFNQKYVRVASTGISNHLGKKLENLVATTIEYL